MDNIKKEVINEILKTSIKLENIDEIKKVKLGSKLRYFIEVNGKMKFRLGGILLDKSGYPNYITLFNRGVCWSVQLNNSIIFYQLNNNELKKLYEKLNEKQMKKILKLREINNIDNTNKEIKYNLKGNIINNYNDIKSGDYIKLYNKNKKEKIECQVIEKYEFNKEIYNFKIRIKNRIDNIDPKEYLIEKLNTKTKEVNIDLKYLEELMN